MRNGIVVCLGEGRYKNIGDYVQSVAAAQFSGPSPVLVERERLSRRFKVFVNWPKIAWFPARLAYAAVFYRIYSTLFAPEVLLEADYVCHAVVKPKGRGDDSYLELAKKMLHRYETASFVVTSRLHCTLPCIGMGTSVWTVVNPRMMTGRFGGNEDFMNLIDLSDGRLSPRGPLETVDGRIHLDTPPPVSDAFRPYAEVLAEKCRAFYAARDEVTA